jgi:hypothetical protein
MTNFKAYIVKYDNSDPKNFIPMENLPSELFDQETWKRNKIKEVHVLSSVAFVANTALKLRALMLPLNKFITAGPPVKLEKRIQSELAPKHGDPAQGLISFEKMVEQNAK